MSQDVLCHAFSFLDYSYTATLSLVCKEWQQIANSNSLWEFYFHQLTNNKKGRTRVSPSVASHDLFWKNKMRDNFSQYACRMSKRFSVRETKFHLQLEESFPDHFSSQVVKMILSRILLDSLESIENFDLPYKMCFIENASFDRDHFRIKFKISGIEEMFIVRWCVNVHSDMNFLFSTDYTCDFYLYFSTESHDKLNMKYMKGKKIDTEKIALEERAFIFKFNDKKKQADIWGKDYLCDIILSHIVPNINQYEISPIEFVPFWCLLFSMIIEKKRCRFIPFPKLITKHYPFFSSSRLAYHFVANLYKTNYTFSEGLIESFQNYRPNTDAQKKLHKSIIGTTKIPPVRSQQSSEFYETFKYLRGLVGTNLKFIAGPCPYMSMNNDEFIRNAKGLAKFYKLLKKPEEMKELFLNYKMKRWD